VPSRHHTDKPQKKKAVDESTVFSMLARLAGGFSTSHAKVIDSSALLALKLGGSGPKKWVPLVGNPRTQIVAKFAPSILQCGSSWVKLDNGVFL
jgi:hypothetical protein